MTDDFWRGFILALALVALAWLIGTALLLLAGAV